MKKLKIYLDTSVISHLDAHDAPKEMNDTLKLWEQIRVREYEVVLSDVVFNELARCSEPKGSRLDAFLRQIQYSIAKEDENALALAGKFIDLKVLKEKSLNDCRHIAAALVSGCDAIASWNFKHIVNAKTIRGTKAITALEGYKDLIICSPTMLIGGIDDE